MSDRDKFFLLFLIELSIRYPLTTARGESFTSGRIRSLSALITASKSKSFHADTYCFDSNPEKECFNQYIFSNRVKEVYFTGMFTSKQGDLAIYH